MLASARIHEQGSNPLAGRSLMHLFALSIPVGRLCAALQEQPDDAGLLLTRLWRTAASSPGGLNGKVQGVDPPWLAVLSSPRHPKALVLPPATAFAQLYAVAPPRRYRRRWDLRQSI
jgi:hypothetical protein